MTSTSRDLRGQEKLLVYCPQIADDTFLHFSQRGESYKLRAFNGRLAGKPPWAQKDAPTATDFMHQYRPEITVDVRRERINLKNTERWTDIVADYNRRHGVGA